MATYTTAKIASLIRSKLDDTVSPYLVSDEDLYTALDMAQREFAERTLCLTDASTYTIAVVATTASYTLSERIIKVRRGYLETSLSEALPATLAEMDSVYVASDYGISAPNWRTATGTPENIVTDFEINTVRLVPIPTVTETMTLTAYVYPTPVIGTDNALEIPDRWRTALVAGALAEIYSSQDNDVYDPKAANMWLNKWERAVRSAVGQIERNSRGPGVVRMSRNSVW